MKEKIYLVSFGDSRLGISNYRFKLEAEQMGVFDDIFVYTEASLPLDFKEHFKDKLWVKRDSGMAYVNSGPSLKANDLVPSRGFGYWCWKPKVILMVLEQIKENDILIFCDIGVQFNVERKEMIFDMVEQAKKDEIKIFTHNILERYHQKGDTLRYFNLIDDEKFLNHNQVAAGVIFMKKCAKTLKVINEWMSVFYERFDLVTDEPSKTPNHPDFAYNLHDQSILSCVAYKNKLKNFPVEFYHDSKNKAINYNRNKVFLSNDLKITYFLNETLNRGFHGNVHIEPFVENYQSLRFKNHLSYKLGFAMMNSKSFFELVSLPFVLYFIAKMHKKENLQSANLPPLESCKEHEGALRIKSFLTYKLGENLILNAKKYGNFFGFLKFACFDVFFVCKKFRESKK